MAQQLPLFGPGAWHRRVECSPQEHVSTPASVALVDEPPSPALGEPLPRTRWLELAVAQAAGLPVRLIITDNRHTLLSWRAQEHPEEGVIIRAHHMFLDAPQDVAVALGRYVANPRRHLDGALLDRFMAARRHLVTRDRRPLGTPQGRFHDLARIFQHLNDTEFDGTVQARIGWGEPGSPRRRRRRSIQLGCYDPESSTIVIHPALDQAFVPEFFVTAVVFHEMLHQQIPAKQDAGRRCIHSRQFKVREERFPLTAAARTWERAHVDQLLAYRGEAQSVNPGVAARRAGLSRSRN